MAFPNLTPQTMYSVGNLTSILNFLKPLLPIKNYKAIKAIFSPCCELVISGVSFVVSGSNYNVTVTLVNPVSFYDVPEFQLIENGIVVATNGIQTASTTIAFQNVTLTAGTLGVAISALVPTSSDGNVGYYQSSIPLVVAVP